MELTRRPEGLAALPRVAAGEAVVTADLPSRGERGHGATGSGCVRVGRRPHHPITEVSALGFRAHHCGPSAPDSGGAQVSRALRLLGGDQQRRYQL